MAEPGLARAPAIPAADPTAPLAGGGPAGVTVRRLDDLAIASVIARRGEADALGARFGRGPTRGAARGVEWLGVGPGRWLAVAKAEPSEFAAALERTLVGRAAVADQSDAYAVVEVGGPKARTALAKGVPVDLHPAGFGPDQVAVTMATHMGLIVWRGEGEDAFRLAAFRSNAGGLWHWLMESAAEFGVEVL